MRVVFFGIYDLGRAALEALAAAGLEPATVVTKPRRGNERQPVAEWAIHNRLPLLEPETPKAPGFLRQIQQLAPDLLVVAGYHRIIPACVLDVPGKGAINLHGSLLPAYRGPCPWKQVILAGETRTGVTVHVMTPELDGGDILVQAEVPIEEEDTGGSLFRRICGRGGVLLAETVQQIAAGPVRRMQQDARLATYFGYPSEEQTRIPWHASAGQIHRLVRAMSPRPGAWTQVHGWRLRVWHVIRCDGEVPAAEPGTILSVSGGGLKVATGTYPLIVDQAGVEVDGHLAPLWLGGTSRPRVGELLDAAGSPDAAAPAGG